MSSFIVRIAHRARNRATWPGAPTPLARAGPRSCRAGWTTLPTLAFLIALSTIAAIGTTVRDNSQRHSSVIRAACPAFVRIVDAPAPPPDRYEDQTTAQVVVEYGEDTAPGGGGFCVVSGRPDTTDFGFTVNGTNQSASFTHALEPGGEFWIATATALSLPTGRTDTLIATAHGYASSGDTTTVADTTLVIVPNYSVQVVTRGSIDSLEASMVDTVEYVVRNTSSHSATFNIACSFTGAVQSCMPHFTLDTLINAGDSVVVRVRVQAGTAADSGHVTLTATGPLTGRGQAQASATHHFRVYRRPRVSVAYTGGERRIRSACPTVGAGAGSAVQCGDLIFAHSFPAYRTMNESRGLTLLYSSATAAPTPVVAVDFRAYPNDTIDTLRVTVTRTDTTGTGAVLRALVFKPTAVNGLGTEHRLVVPIDAAASGLTTRAYPVRVIVTSVSSAGAIQGADTALTRVHVVDRRGSPFGAGWWPAGIEQLHPQSDGALLVHADGSTVFFAASGGVLVAPPGERSTLTALGGGGYERALKGNRVKIYYGSSGRVDSLRDNNPQRNRGRYVWRTVAGLTALDSIIDPAGKVVRFGRNGTTGLVDSIRIPGVALARLHHTTGSGATGATLDSLADPDNFRTRFSYRTGTRLLATSHARGTGVYRYTYDAINRADSTVSPTGSSVTPIVVAAWQRSGAPTAAKPGTASQPADAARKDSVRFNFRQMRNATAENSVWFITDPTGAPTLVRHVDNERTKITRDSIGQPLRIQTQLGVDVQQVWSTGGNLEKTIQFERGPWTNRNAHRHDTTSYTYHSTWQSVASVRLPGSSSADMTIAYDSVGRRASMTDPRGAVTRFFHGARGLLDSIAEPDPATAGNAEALPTVYAYDSTTWNLTSVRKGGRVTRYAHDSASRTQLVASVNAVGDSVHYTYDAIGRVLEVLSVGHDLLTSAVDYAYNDTLRTRSLIDPAGRITKWYHDATGRPDSTSHPGPGVSRVGYTGLETTALTERGNVNVSQRFDTFGRLAARITVQDSIGYLYDRAGNLIHIDNQYSRIRRRYDLYGRLTCEHQGIRYWADSVPSDSQRFAGVTAYHEYDRKGRRARTFLGTAGCTDPYDGEGEQVPVEQGEWELWDVGFSVTPYPIYETAANSWVPVANEIAFTYDTVGNLTRLRNKLWGSGTSSSPDKWEYDYDLRNRPLQLTPPWPSQSGTRLTSWSYNDQGDVDTVRTPVGGLVTGLTHDSLGRILSYTGGHTGQHRYDGLGRLKITEHNAVHDTIRYDSSGNRVRTKRDTLRYDQATGRLEWQQTLSSGCIREYGYDARGNQQTASVDAVSCGDANGHRTMVYDHENRLIQTTTTVVVPSADCLNRLGRMEQRDLWYDGLRRRILMRSDDRCAADHGLWRYFWLDDHVAVKVGNLLPVPPDTLDLEDVVWPGIQRSNNTTTGGGEWFVYGPGTDNVLGSYSLSHYELPGLLTNQRRIYFQDYRGSVIESRSPDGTNTYGATPLDADGKGGAESRPGFNGTEQMAGLVYMRNRWYDPNTGRFTQEDPIGHAGGINLYAYAGNDPVTYSDPFGLCPPVNEDTSDCPIGSGSGEEATEFWADLSVNGSNKAVRGAATVAGMFSAAWTPETAERTGKVLLNASVGTVLQVASRVSAVRGALNGASVGSSSRIMASIKFNPSERSIAIIADGKRVLDAGVHAIGRSPLGTGRQVPHVNIGAASRGHVVKDLIAGIRFIF